MLRLGPKAKILLGFLCILVVAMRITGAHLHLCFDGSEPPASVHFDGDGLAHHDDAHAQPEQHSDVDIDLIADALLKLGALDLDLLGLLAALSLILFFLPFVRDTITHRRPVAAFLAARHFFRPPLRGPPRLA